MYLGDVSVRDSDVHIFQLPEVVTVGLVESSIVVTSGGYLVQKIEYRPPLGFPGVEGRGQSCCCSAVLAGQCLNLLVGGFDEIPFRLLLKHLLQCFFFNLLHFQILHS